jgi:hypothetical protein
MQMLLTLYLFDNCSETSLTISAVAPVRTGLQLIIKARIPQNSFVHNYAEIYPAIKYQSLSCI